MASPNMTVRQLNRWTRTDAYQDYADSHPNRDVEAVVERAKRVIKGTATDEEESKVSGFIARMRANQSGSPVNGSGSTAVSNRTASLRNWGYDPTGRFS